MKIVEGLARLKETSIVKLGKMLDEGIAPGNPRITTALSIPLVGDPQRLAGAYKSACAKAVRAIERSADWSQLEASGSVLAGLLYQNNSALEKLSTQKVAGAAARIYLQYYLTARRNPSEVRDQ